MPGRPRTRRRRTRRKRTRRGRKMTLYKRIRRSGTVFTKIRRNINVNMDANGLFKQSFYNTPPFNMSNGFPKFCDLYDQYKCYAIKLKFIPARPWEPTTISGANYGGYVPVYLFADDNSIEFPKGITNYGTKMRILGYSTSRTKNMNFPWTYYHRWKVPSGFLPLPDMTRFLEDTDATKGYRGTYLQGEEDPLKGDTGLDWTTAVHGQRYGGWYLPQTQDAMMDYHDAYVEGAKGASSTYSSCSGILQGFHNRVQEFAEEGLQPTEYTTATQAAMTIDNTMLKNGWLPTAGRANYGIVGVFIDNGDTAAFLNMGILVMTYYLGFRSRNLKYE